MSYESKAEPIKVGYLMDFLLSDDFPQHYRDDLTIPFDPDLGRQLDSPRLDGLRIPGCPTAGTRWCQLAARRPLR